jgi:hypothetical protein
MQKSGTKGRASKKRGEGIGGNSDAGERGDQSGFG